MDYEKGWFRTHSFPQAVAQLLLEAKLKKKCEAHLMPEGDRFCVIWRKA